MLASFQVSFISFIRNWFRNSSTSHCLGSYWQKRANGPNLLGCICICLTRCSLAGINHWMLTLSTGVYESHKFTNVYTFTFHDSPAAILLAKICDIHKMHHMILLHMLFFLAICLGFYLTAHFVILGLLHWLRNPDLPLWNSPSHQVPW